MVRLWFFVGFAMIVAACGDSPSAPPPPPPPPPPASRPVFTITSPTRAAMLQRGTFDPDNVGITGQVCDPHRPITSLTLSGTAVPVSGTELCASFNVVQPSPWGLTIITGEATNSSGATTHLAQSFLRGPEYWLPLDNPTPAQEIPHALHAQFSQSVIDDNNTTTVDDFATLAGRMFTAMNPNTFFPNPVGVNPDANGDGQLDSRTYDCLFGSKVNYQTGYRVTRGTLTQGTVTVEAAVDADPNGGILFSVRVNNVTVPITVMGSLDLGCVGEINNTATGTMTASSVTYSFTLQPTYPIGGGVEFRVSAPQVSTQNMALDIDWSGFAFIDNLISTITTASLSAFNAALRDFLLGMLAPTISDLWAGMMPELTADAVLAGTDVTATADTFSFPSGAARVGFTAQVTPETVRAGPAPARGALLRYSIPPVFAGLPFELGTAVQDDFVNRLLWSQWRSGTFDMASLASLGCDAILPGAALSTFAELPPVLMGSAGQSVSIGLGDLRLTGTVDGKQVVLYASGILSGTLGVSTTNLLEVASESGFTLALEVAQIDDTSAIAAVRSAATPYLTCITRALVTLAVHGVPLLEIPAPAVPGVPAGTWRPSSATVSREGDYTVVRGSVSP